jgi:hypothetical protein
MKTKKITTTNRSLKGKMILRAVSLLLVAQSGICQKRQSFQLKGTFGIFASASISANRYGGQYSPMLYYKKDRGTYYLGPIIQNQKLNVSGMRFNYDFTIAGKGVEGNEPEDCDMELFCFVTTAYYCNAILGKKAQWEERMENKDNTADPGKFHFQSAEAFAGIGLRTTLFQNIKWVNCIGLGGSTTFNLPDNASFSGNNFGLTMKTGITFDINK